MKVRTTRARRWRLATVTALALLLTAVPAWSASTTLPNGADLSVDILSPANGTEILADGAPVAVPVNGTASVGLGDPSATFVYVFDASGSTGASGGACGTILACEKTFFTGLNSAADASGSVNQIGIAVFGADAVTADVTPMGGDDPLTGTPLDGNNVFNSIVLTGGGVGYQVGQYTVKNGNATATNYAAALNQALSILAASTDPRKFLVFASDGLSNAGGLAAFNTAVANLAATGTVANSIAIGASASCSGGTNGTLNAIAVNGGACFSVPDPNDLPDIIPNLIGSTLEKVELTVDGGAPTVLTTTPATPAAGPVMVTWATNTAPLGPGSHQICATAFGSDVTGGTANVSECVTIEVFDLVLAPATATNNLGGGDNSHTVTATLLGPAGAVGGYTVNFAVAGTNAGATGVCVPASCQTNAAGVVTFTYTVPIAPASLGNDSITASVTLNTPNGQTDTETVAKAWVDTTPPVVTCQPTTNPSGKNVPPAGENPKSGQNPDGFYILVATDLVDPNPQIRVRDSASPFVAGPYSSGTKIKLTQAPGGNPNAKPGPGDIDWHITLNGDAIVAATDASGNTATVSCLVPPPPK
jgi:hypothetical protein